MSNRRSKIKRRRLLKSQFNRELGQIANDREMTARFCFYGTVPVRPPFLHLGGCTA